MSKINESDRESARRGIHEIESAYLKFEQSEVEAYWRISALTLAVWQAIPDIAHVAARIHADIAGLDAWLAQLNQSEKRCHPDNASAPIRDAEIEKIETAWPQASAALRRVLYAVTADENESAIIATIGARNFDSCRSRDKNRCQTQASLQAGDRGENRESWKVLHAQEHRRLSSAQSEENHNFGDGSNRKRNCIKGTPPLLKSRM